MQGGQLRKRVLLQQRSASVDGYGQQSLVWTDLAMLWADIQVISGSQLARSQSIYSMTTHHVICRYQPMFQNVKQVGAYRLVYVVGTVVRYFDIGASMIEDERNRLITLLANEGLNDGQ
jgi:SPP1 family predicted phage head-tail adaptor